MLFPTFICSLLKGVVNLLASGKVLREVSIFLTGGTLAALNKLKDGCLPDFRPIAVGEVVRPLIKRLHVCALFMHAEGIWFLQTLTIWSNMSTRLWNACPLGSHGIRSCVQNHWGDENFAVLKIDFQNAFNLVPRDALLHDYAVYFPGLLPWATWFYSSHPIQ